MKIRSYIDKDVLIVGKDDIIIILTIIILFLVAIGFFKLFYSVPT